RDVERGVASRLAGGGQRVDLGMRCAEALVPAFTDNLVIAHEHGADERVGLDVASAALGHFESPLHPRPIARAHERIVTRRPPRKQTRGLNFCRAVKASIRLLAECEAADLAETCGGDVEAERWAFPLTVGPVRAKHLGKPLLLVLRGQPPGAVLLG